MNNTKEQLKEWWNENKNDICRKVKTGVKVACLAVGSYKLGQCVRDIQWAQVMALLKETVPDLPVKDLFDSSKTNEIIEEVTKKFGKN